MNVLVVQHNFWWSGTTGPPSVVNAAVSLTSEHFALKNRPPFPLLSVDWLRTLLLSSVFFHLYVWPQLVVGHTEIIYLALVWLQSVVGHMFTRSQK